MTQHTQITYASGPATFGIGDCVTRAVARRAGILAMVKASGGQGG